ncbi:MAG: hypothetical protein AB8G95_21405 [Anaerolineae bacterium]
MLNFWKSIFGQTIQPKPEHTTSERPEPITQRVLMIVHDPRFPDQGNRQMHKLFNWQDPEQLARRYAQDVHEVSHGYANYELVEQISVDTFPIKLSGFRYTADEYWNCRQGHSSFYQPDAVDYHAIMQKHQVFERIASGEIDEIWLFGFPYAGYYESIMAGPRSIFCNAPPLLNSDQAQRRFVIMGFSYERGVGEMLENLGHRAESILSHVYQREPESTNYWEQFTRYDQKNPGRAACGNVHFAPNSVKDYDWGNSTKVYSTCDDWLNFPNLTGDGRMVNSQDWGRGDTRAHHKWWFERFPAVVGETNGISHNWWEYVLDPNKVR